MIKVTSHSIQGKRFYQEDRIVVKNNLGYITAAIIDGHGGSFTAEHIKEYIEKNNLGDYPSTFKKLHENVIKEYNDGACLLLCDIFEESGTFGIAYVGDCVAFHKKENEVIQLNEIHGVYNEKELKRIEEQTGKKQIIHGPYLMEDWRSGNGIMPTRTIGDRNFTRVGVTYEPEIITGKLLPDESLILVTDGVTDVLEKHQLEGNANDIVIRAYQNGSSDNISAVVITKE